MRRKASDSEVDLAHSSAKEPTKLDFFVGMTQRLHADIWVAVDIFRRSNPGETPRNAYLWTTERIEHCVYVMTSI